MHASPNLQSKYNTVLKWTLIDDHSINETIVADNSSEQNSFNLPNITKCHEDNDSDHSTQSIELFSPDIISASFADLHICNNNRGQINLDFDNENSNSTDLRNEMDTKCYENCDTIAFTDNTQPTGNSYLRKYKKSNINNTLRRVRKIKHQTQTTPKRRKKRRIVTKVIPTTENEARYKTPHNILDTDVLLKILQHPKQLSQQERKNMPTWIRNAIINIRDTAEGILYGTSPIPDQKHVEVLLVKCCKLCDHLIMLYKEIPYSSKSTKQQLLVQEVHQVKESVVFQLNAILDILHSIDSCSLCKRKKSSCKTTSCGAQHQSLHNQPTLNIEENHNYEMRSEYENHESNEVDEIVELYRNVNDSPHQILTADSQTRELLLHSADDTTLNVITNVSCQPLVNKKRGCLKKSRDNDKKVLKQKNCKKRVRYVLDYNGNTAGSEIKLSDSITPTRVYYPGVENYLKLQFNAENSQITSNLGCSEKETSSTSNSIGTINAIKTTSPKCSQLPSNSLDMQSNSPSNSAGDLVVPETESEFSVVFPNNSLNLADSDIIPDSNQQIFTEPFYQNPLSVTSKSYFNNTTSLSSNIPSKEANLNVSEIYSGSSYENQQVETKSQKIPVTSQVLPNTNSFEFQNYDRQNSQNIPETSQFSRLTSETSPPNKIHFSKYRSAAPNYNVNIQSKGHTKNSKEININLPLSTSCFATKLTEKPPQTTQLRINEYQTSISVTEISEKNALFEGIIDLCNTPPPNKDTGVKESNITDHTFSIISEKNILPNLNSLPSFSLTPNVSDVITFQIPGMKPIKQTSQVSFSEDVLSQSQENYTQKSSQTVSRSQVKAHTNTNHPRNTQKRQRYTSFQKYLCQANNTINSTQQSLESQTISQFFKTTSQHKTFPPQNTQIEHNADNMQYNCYTQKCNELPYPLCKPPEETNKGKEFNHSFNSETPCIGSVDMTPLKTQDYSNNYLIHQEFVMDQRQNNSAENMKSKTCKPKHTQEKPSPVIHSRSHQNKYMSNFPEEQEINQINNHTQNTFYNPPSVTEYRHPTLQKPHLNGKSWNSQFKSSLLSSDSKQSDKPKTIVFPLLPWQLGTILPESSLPDMPSLPCPLLENSFNFKNFRIPKFP